MELLRSHPYGVQPVGNHIYATSADGQRTPGLGRAAAVPDSMWLTQICPYFDGPSLSQLSACSKFLYAFCHYDEFWKNLVLASSTATGTPFNYSKSWKETYTQRPHTPIHVRVFSDVLYQPFWCSALKIPTEWTHVETVRRESIQHLSTEQFVQKYEIPNQPVILTGCHHHPGSRDAYTKWNRTYMTATAQPTTTFNAAGHALSLDSYFKYSDQQKDDSPLYLFDKHFITNTPQFGLDYEPLPYFNTQRDLFHLLTDTGYRPDHRWLIVGPERSGSRFHVDPNGTSAWNAVITGAKKWILFPPHSIPPGVHPSADGGDVTSPVSLIEWFRGFYQNAVEECVSERTGVRKQKDVLLLCFFFQTGH